MGPGFLQEQPDRLAKRISLLSPLLDTAEQDPDTIQLECLAVPWAALLLRPYLWGFRFTIYMDEEAMYCILNMTVATQNLSDGSHAFADSSLMLCSVLTSKSKWYMLSFDYRLQEMRTHHWTATKRFSWLWNHSIAYNDKTMSVNDADRAE